MPTGIGGEVAWWCPSLDNSGNGTATLYDLAGSNNGTLTNMDPATDWVADTDSGGVRRLDFDRSDRVVLGSVAASVWTFSVWTRVTSFGAAFRRIFGQTSFRIDIAISEFGLLSCYDGTSWKTFGSAVTLNTWQHHIVTYDGTSLRAYRNGTQIGSTTTGGRSMTGVSRIGDYVSGAAAGDGNQFIGGLDDIRIFSRVVSSDERTLLASQRGYQPASSDFETVGMFGGMSVMTGGMAS